MAVAYVTDVDATPATATSIITPSIAVSGSNPVIVVVVGLDITSGAASVTGITLNSGLSGGTPVLAASHTKGNSYSEVWAVPAPSGTGTLTVNLSASRPFQCNALVMSGADQTTPCPTGAGNVGATDGDGSTATLSVSSLTNLTANDAAVGLGINVGSGDAPTWNQSQTFNNNTTNINCAAGYNLGTGAVSVTWGAATTESHIAAVRVVAVSGGGGASVVAPSTLTLLGVQ